MHRFEFPPECVFDAWLDATFEEQGAKTKVHARQTFHVMMPEIEHATEGAKQGWTMTLDQLASFCLKEKLQ